MADTWKVWANLIVTVITGIGSSALAVSYLDARNRGIERSADTRLLALRVAADLEIFAERCSDVDTTDSSGRRPTMPQLPALPTWELSDRWQLLPVRIVSRLWAMPVKRLDALSYIESAIRFTDRPTTARVTRDEAVLLGAEAWEIARELRASYGMPLSPIATNVGQRLVEERSGLIRRWRTNQEPTIFLV